MGNRQREPLKGKEAYTIIEFIGEGHSNKVYKISRKSDRQIFSLKVSKSPHHVAILPEDHEKQFLYTPNIDNPFILKAYDEFYDSDFRLNAVYEYGT